MRRSRRRLAALALLALALVVLAVVGLSPAATKARPAPPLPRERLSGPRVTLASLLANARGHPALVVFWASWCPPCQREAPALERFARTPDGRGRLVGVDYEDELAHARGFVAEHDWTFPNLRDNEGTVGEAYRLVNLPETFLIDGSGHIREVLRGQQTLASLQRGVRSAESA